MQSDDVLRLYVCQVLQRRHARSRQRPRQNISALKAFQTTIVTSGTTCTGRMTVKMAFSERRSCGCLASQILVHIYIGCSIIFVYIYTAFDFAELRFCAETRRLHINQQVGSLFLHARLAVRARSGCIQVRCTKRQIKIQPCALIGTLQGIFVFLYNIKP